MENEKEYCEKLIKRWEELKGKLPKIQEVIPGKPLKASYISSTEIKEFYTVMEKLKNECSEFLSPRERFEINERIKFNKPINFS